MSLLEAIQQPSLNINGIRAADVGDKARNVIPTSAAATLDLRLVKGNDHDRQVEKLVRHIQAQGFHVLDREPTMEERRRYPRIATVTASPGYNAERTPLDDPLARGVAAAVKPFGAVVLPSTRRLAAALRLPRNARRADGHASASPTTTTTSTPRTRTCASAICGERSTSPPRSCRCAKAPANDLLGALELLGQLRDDLEQVADQADVGDLEDRRVLVLVDGDDGLANPSCPRGAGSRRKCRSRYRLRGRRSCRSGRPDSRWAHSRHRPRRGWRRRRRRACRRAGRAGRGTARSSRRRGRPRR